MSLDAAIAQLEASRQRLRGVMVPPPGDPLPSMQGQGLWQRGRVLWRYLRQTSARRHPVLRLAAEAVQDWWLAHPLRQLAQTVALPVHDAAAPVVRRHPWSAVVLAAAGGAALAVARPWRWTMVRQQMRLARRRSVNWALALVGGPVGQALIATLLASAATMTAAGRPSEPHDGAEDPPAPADPSQAPGMPAAQTPSEPMARQEEGRAERVATP